MLTKLFLRCKLELNPLIVFPKKYLPKWQKILHLAKKTTLSGILM